MSRSPSRSDRASEASADSLDTPPQPPTADTAAMAGNAERQHSQSYHEDNHSNHHDDGAEREKTGAEENAAEGEPRNEANASANANESADAANVTALFIGLGPAARNITEDEIRTLLAEKASDPALIGDVRLRGRCAFADIKSPEEATKLISALDGEMYQDKCRLAVQISRHPRREGSGERRERRPPRARAVPSLFVGLGPAGDNIGNDEVRNKLEEVCPLTAFRRRGQCVFVEVATVDDAEKMIANMNNQYIGAARLSVQYSRDSNSRGDNGGRRGGRGGPMMGGMMPPPFAPAGTVGGYYGGHPSSSRGRVEAMGGRRNERLRERSRSRGRDERRRSRRAHRSDSRDRRRRRRSRSLRSLSPRSASYSRSRSRSRPRRVSPPSSRASSDSRDRRSRRHYPARRV